MAITTRTRLLGYLLALSVLSAVPETAAAAGPQTGAGGSASVDARLSRIARALQARAEAPAAGSPSAADPLLAYGWADGRGNRGWVNTRYGGAARGGRGSWANANPYYGPRRVFSNGGGGFYNARYRPGRTFVNW
jgi:rSAM-associated Gly-rich repeat protein